MTKLYDSTGRPVQILETDGGYEEAYVVSASYLDIDPELPDSEYSKLSKVPDNELDYLTEQYFEYVSDEEFQKSVCEAEYAFEGDR
jgi:hypothetical protein